jgi:hypothetical protein
VEFIRGVPEDIANAASAIWTWITDRFDDAYEDVRTRITDFIETVTGLPRRIRNGVEGLWDSLPQAFRDALNSIIRLWNDLEFKLPSFAGLKVGGITVIPGWEGPTLRTPNIRPLAKGGIVPATRGGILATIGEAGRPERVEPLDPDGLSKRDKAMIQLLSGGGGINITVNPAPGMDERELAAMVSRQLAFQLRKGA